MMDDGGAKVVTELSGLSAFIQRYYIDPIIYDTSYNPVDTITWALKIESG